MSYTPFEKVGFAIGGLLIAGRCELTPPKTTYEWLKPQVKGTTGNRAKYLGRNAREFKLTVTITTREQYAAWMALRDAKLQPPSKKEPFVVAVDHPMLADYGIRYAIVLSDEGPIRDGQLDRWTVTLEMCEQDEPKVTAVAVKGTAPKDLAKGVQDQSLAVAELERARAELAALGKALTAEQARFAYSRWGKDANALGAEPPPTAP